MNNILIALDLSDFSAEVEKRGYALAEQLNASVTLVSVIQHVEYARADTGAVFDDNPAKSGNIGYGHTWPHRVLTLVAG